MFEQYQDFQHAGPGHSSFNGPHAFLGPGAKENHNNQHFHPKNAATLVSIYDPRDGEVYFIMGKTNSKG